MRKNHHFGTGNGYLSTDGQEAGKLQAPESQEERGKGKPKNRRPASGACPCEREIEKLVDSLTRANNVLLSYVNLKIAELDECKQKLLARISELTVEAISSEQVSQIARYLDTWENVFFDDGLRVVNLMITTIAATSDRLNIKLR